MAVFVKRQSGRLGDPEMEAKRLCGADLDGNPSRLLATETSAGVVVTLLVCRYLQ